jgi:hypothetical protein
MYSSTSKLFKKVDSSDYITAKRRMTISKEYIKANDLTQFNPVKNNGFVYNKNFSFLPTISTPITDASNCLVNAASFELLDNYNFGQSYIKQICDTSDN